MLYLHDLSMVIRLKVPSELDGHDACIQNETH